MNRRRALAAGCACGAAVFTRLAGAQAWTAPARFTRPQPESDEAGIWAMTEREETRLKRSPFIVRDARLQGYVQDIACRLAGDHCPDIRVYVVRTPEFNASMAPNGMMQLCTGLMLRMENEAQLAAVMAHEIGHYLERHMIDRLRDTRDRAALARFIGLFGIVGSIGSAAVIATGFAYSRDQ
jgi:predicted Zn-dependent protease